ncbi:acyltransferase domain-containing protein [Klebsiella pneumoniae]|nr:acyltransferase domain-containing protein [Klebsiella pneumoniae]
MKRPSAEASAALGYDLRALTQQGPAEELDKTWQTQLALLAASVALYRVWQQQGGKAPALLAGHSLGEYSALVRAGVIGFADAVRPVELRVVNSCRKPYRKVPAQRPRLSVCTTPLSPKPQKNLPKGRWSLRVNHNSPGQVVIAGHKEAVERAGAAFAKPPALNARCRCR